ncbi:hypothetical protein BYT27DRAFT_7188350 [Phlegmacium glaucopus]|nr:hypothetical protein BYT27DRAFT_7188350 [Phlegmacium glaucopus]
MVIHIYLEVAFSQSYDHITQSILQSFDFKVVNKMATSLFPLPISVHDVLDPFLASFSLNRPCSFSQETISPFNSAPTASALLSRATLATS